MLRKKRVLYLQIIISLIILGYIFYSLNIRETINAFFHIKILPASLSILFTFLFFFSGAYNFHFVLNRFYRIPFRHFLKSYTYSFVINLAAPAHMGDASIPFFLKKYNVPVELTGISYLLDKFNTLLIYTIVAIVGAYIIFPDLNPFLFSLVPLAFISIVSIILLLIKFIPFKNKLIIKIKNASDRLVIQVKKLRHRLLLIIINLFLSVLKWIILCLVYYCAFKAFMPDPPFPEIGIIPIISSLVGLMPITFGGIGTVELSAIYMFGLVGVNKIVVLNSYIFLRVIQYLIAFIIYITGKIRGLILKCPENLTVFNLND